MSSSSQSKPPRKNLSNQRSTLSHQRTEIKIHVYDLLPPGKIADVLWALGSALLHSGVVIGDKEYAYGGHDEPNMSGVYSTSPGQEPPGGTFKQAILHGFSYRPEEEMTEIIHEVSQEFQGTSYDLLTKNCNHFTSYLCERLTGRPAPAWLNRAASIGVALPCVVPREWIEPPDHDTADGELLDEDFLDERSSMLRHDKQRRQRDEEEAVLDRHTESGPFTASESRGGHESAGDSRWDSSRIDASRSLKDTSNRKIPAAERAPLPRQVM